MGDVVYLEKKPAPKPAGSYANYYCLKCHRDFFRIFADGEVQCYTCGAHMSNLEVQMKK